MHSSMLFYTKGLTISKLWYLQGSWNKSAMDTEGWLQFLGGQNYVDFCGTRVSDTDPHIFKGQLYCTRVRVPLLSTIIFSADILILWTFHKPSYWFNILTPLCWLNLMSKIQVICMSRWFRQLWHQLLLHWLCFLSPSLWTSGAFLRTNNWGRTKLSLFWK